MRRAVLADTGPLYAAVDPHDEHHDRAVRELQNLASEKREVLTAFPTLFEAYSLVVSRLGPKVAMGWLAEMAETALLNPTVEDYRAAFARLRLLPDQQITLFDAALAVLATRLELEVWTYDHHFDVMRVPVWRG
jgi:predicted nucleic acid-binding protein